MENRLQFRHHTPIFDTREEAIEYIKIQIRRAEEGLAADDPSYGFSLFAEPTIIRYKNEEDETNPHVILAIGAETNETTFHDNNRFCFIDIDKTEKEIAELDDKVEDAIRAFTLNALETNTVKLTSEVTESGTDLSADVKLAEGKIFDDIRRPNSIIASDSGLFLYVNMTYDIETDTIKFIVNGDILNVKLSNSKLASGYYDKRDESLHLVSNDGSEVVVDCEELIAEWSVEGEASRTPVVLTRDENGYGSEDSHSHIEPWQDVLMADVRLKDEQKITENGVTRYVKDANSTNILNRTTDGRYLYVDGRASSIIYYVNGEKTTVKDALDRVANIKLSGDNDNILTNRTDGFFASTTLDYVSRENTLVFKASGQEEKRIKLNSVKLFEEIYYDSTSESLVIIYTDGNGEVQTERIPIGEMMDQWEWEPFNEAHNVEITRARHPAGNDKVSADVKLYDDENNILVDRNHSLFVKGTADNIKYGDNSTVKDALDSIIESGASASKVTELEEALNSEIERSTEKDAEHDAAIAEIKATADAAINDIVNEDHSINVDKADPLKPVVSVNLSSEVEDGRKNIIKLNNDGLYANVDLSYVQGENKLIFHTSGEETDKEIKLDGGWRPSENTDGAILLIKTAYPGEPQEVLSAGVIINTTHDDNALVNDHGSLYVGANSIVEKSTVFQCLSAETKAVEVLLGVEGECGEAIAYPSDEDSILSAATTYAEADAILEDAINELREEMSGLDVDIIGDTTDTVEVNSYLDDDERRHVEAEVRLQGGGDDVIVDNGNALGVIGNEGLYLSKTWDCGEYSDTDSEDADDDDAYMNYQRLS